jgi:glycosyltransferase involved in cell wall biosynthesis
MAPADKPLKVMHVITRFIRGGAQENTLLTVQGLDAMPGYESMLVTGPGLGPEGDLIPDARRRGIRVIEIDTMRREIHPWRDWRSYRALRRCIREIKPDIVHTHSSKAGILARKAAKDEHVPKIVHSIHGLPFHNYESALRNKLYIALERNAAKCTDLIMCVADAMTDKAVAAGVAPREKFVTVYSGMDVEPYLHGRHDRAAVRESFGIAPDELVVGVVARISPLKGHEFIIRAAPQILAKHPAMRLLFVGEGHIRAEMEQLAAKHNVLDRIVFAGLRDYREIPELIASMELVVHTSLREGLARVLPQALLSGVPVVSYDVDGAREVVINGKTGWLVKAEAIGELADAVCEALGDLDHARELAAAGREICKQWYPAEVMVGAIAREYQKLLEKQ